jgi:ferredoxin-type protein NapH
MTLTELIGKRQRISWYAGLIMAYLFLIIAIGYEINTKTNSAFQETGRIFFIIFAFISAFLLFFLDKGSRIRMILFSIMAVVFVFSFMSHFYLERGHIGITENDLTNGTPFCHIAIINNLLSLPIIKTFVYPGNLTGKYAIYPMILIWFWATILIGKGWCSWGCFYGGWDNLFSSIRKKPILRIKESTSRKLRSLPYAMMASIALLSVVLLIPVFCAYLCPFKTITEFQQVTSFVSWIVFIITVVGFFGFCIFLPFLFGRRIWCTYLCPFGAFQALIGKVFKVFRLKIDKEKCIDCKQCINECRICGITEDSFNKKTFTMYCTNCGACIDQCPKKAIKVSIFGSTITLAVLLDKIINIKKDTFFYKTKTIFIQLIDDLLQPVTLMYFFGLAVIFNFFTGFYFDSITNLELLLRRIFNG